MARTILLESEVAKNFWAETVSTACYISNRVHLRLSLGKSPYELYKGRKPNISYFHPFGIRYTLASAYQKSRACSVEQELGTPQEWKEVLPSTGVLCKSLDLLIQRDSIASCMGAAGVENSTLGTRCAVQ
ncbi:hypothetical protein MLD38_031242 [Melastoma candidum]|uniref:Uncharacterized protein n=1 Tax=Melastoma candidum TaxID=119954 RepID=A0ACB9MQ98_9MYRT|nr:hypothetical protein MLD38_031242 [Melastoma candidum]